MSKNNKKKDSKKKAGWLRSALKTYLPAVDNWLVAKKQDGETSRKITNLAKKGLTDKDAEAEAMSRIKRNFRKKTGKEFNENDYVKDREFNVMGVMSKLGLTYKPFDTVAARKKDLIPAMKDQYKKRREAKEKSLRKKIGMDKKWYRRDGNVND